MLVSGYSLSNILFPFTQHMGPYQVNGKNNLHHFFSPKSTNLTEINGNLVHIDLVPTIDRYSK